MHMLALLFATVALQPSSAPETAYQPCVQAWTFNRFTALEAIDKAAAAGSSFIELYPGQKLSPTSNARISENMPADANYELKQHLKAKNVKWIAYGVTGISTKEDEARKLFRWAKSNGVEVLNTESTDAIDVIDKLSQEYQLNVGFHNHPLQTNNPNYRVWDPAYVYNLVKNRNPRVGACADTGHWVRSGIKPVDAIRTLKGRIVSSHLKDLHEFSPGGHDTIYGKGVSDVPGILKEYAKINMRGPVSVEYEHNWDNNQGDVAQCLIVLKGK